MSFGSLLRKVPERPKLPPDISPVYYHLYDDIANDSSLTPAAKTIVFCAAYTLYSVSKKDSILACVLSGKARSNHDISRSFEKYLNTAGEMNKVIIDAKAFASNYQSELKSFVLDPMMTEIQNLGFKNDELLEIVKISTSSQQEAIKKQDILITKKEHFTLRGFLIHFYYTVLTSFISVMIAEAVAHPDAVRAFAAKIVDDINHIFHLLGT